MYERSVDPGVDSIAAAKASGFFNAMQSFEYIFYLVMMINIFERIEVLNTALQSSHLCVNDSYGKIAAVTDVLTCTRETKFEEIWSKSFIDSQKYEVDEPELPRSRKKPKRFAQDTNASIEPKDVKELYKQAFDAVFDQVLISLKSRFDTDSAKFFKSLEKFAIGESDGIDEIVTFYGQDFEKNRLLSDRNMFLKLVIRQGTHVENLREIIDFFQTYKWTADLVPEFTRFVRLLMTIPGSSCTNERSFSVLRRLKTYLRSTMKQERLNSVAILHVYRHITDKLDLESLMNTFILKNSKRKTAFALRQ